MPSNKKIATPRKLELQDNEEDGKMKDSEKVLDEEEKKKIIHDFYSQIDRKSEKHSHGSNNENLDIYPNLSVEKSKNEEKLTRVHLSNLSSKSDENNLQTSQGLINIKQNFCVPVSFD
jgi:hypothetical protein